MSRIAIWIGAVIAAACGAAIGVLFTVAHRATASVWGFDLPYGLVLGIVAVVALLAAMRLLWEGRIPAIGAGAGVLAGIAAFAFRGAGGGVLIADDALGWTWLVVPAAAVVAAILWPRHRGRRRARTDGSEGADTMDGHPQEPAEEQS